MVAPRILWRYILRDTVLHAALGLTVITLLLCVQNVLRFMEDLVTAGVSLAGIAQLVWIIVPTYLPYAVPTALLFGVLLTFGRMSADGEIVAMRASGISVPGLVPPVVVCGLVCAALSAWLMWEVEPQTRHRMKMLVRELASRTDVLEPGEFKAFDKRMLYVQETGDAECPLRGVMISDFSNARRRQYISAACGRVAAEGSDLLTFELIDGSIHFTDSDQDRYRMIRFETMRTSVDPTIWFDRAKKARELTFAQLLDADRQFRAGERVALRGTDDHASVKLQIHRRLAFPLASVLLAIVAVPLGIRPVRSGRSAGALTAIAVMGLYWMLSTAGELAADSGRVPIVVGIWTPSVCVLVLSWWLMRRAVRSDA